MHRGAWWAAVMGSQRGLLSQAVFSHTHLSTLPQGLFKPRGLNPIPEFLSQWVQGPRMCVYNPFPGCWCCWSSPPLESHRSRVEKGCQNAHVKLRIGELSSTSLLRCRHTWDRRLGSFRTGIIEGRLLRQRNRTRLLRKIDGSNWF